MNIVLLSRLGCFALEIVNKWLAKQRELSESVLIQADWDFPALARTLGWNGKVGRERCRHSGTDGTVDCPDCGRTADEFITAAIGWLDRHDGTVFRDSTGEILRTYFLT